MAPSQICGLPHHEHLGLLWPRKSSLLPEHVGQGFFNYLLINLYPASHGRPGAHRQAPLEAQAEVLAVGACVVRDDRLSEPGKKLAMLETDRM